MRTLSAKNVIKTNTFPYYSMKKGFVEKKAESILFLSQQDPVSGKCFL